MDKLIAGVVIFPRNSGMGQLKVASPWLWQFLQENDIGVEEISEIPSGEGARPVLVRISMKQTPPIERVAIASLCDEQGHLCFCDDRLVNGKGTFNHAIAMAAGARIFVEKLKAYQA